MPQGLSGDEDGWMMGGENRLSWASLPFSSSPAHLSRPTRPFWWSPSINNESILSFLPPLTPLHHLFTLRCTAMASVYGGQTATALNPLIDSFSRVLMCDQTFGYQGNIMVCWVTGSISTFLCLLQSSVSVVLVVQVF